MAELSSRPTHEATFARRLGSLSGRHRRELVDLIGFPPDTSRVTSAFWDRVERETEEEIIALLLLIFIAAATQHGAGESDALARASQFARTRAVTVAKSYASTGKNILDSAANRWGDTLRGGGSVPKGDVLDSAARVFGLDRITNIAITETTNAATSGSDAGMEVSGAGLSGDDIWWTEADSRVCPVCAPLHKTKRERWSLKFPSGPPAHPRCRCWIEYAAMIPSEAVGAR